MEDELRKWEEDMLELSEENEIRATTSLSLAQMHAVAAKIKKRKDWTAKKKREVLIEILLANADIEAPPYSVGMNEATLREFLALIGTPGVEAAKITEWQAALFRRKHTEWCGRIHADHYRRIGAHGPDD